VVGRPFVAVVHADTGSTVDVIKYCDGVLLRITKCLTAPSS
jgi:hypothetical protein